LRLKNRTAKHKSYEKKCARHEIGALVYREMRAELERNYFWLPHLSLVRSTSKKVLRKRSRWVT
jgi:hypothetical protein